MKNFLTFTIKANEFSFNDTTGHASTNPKFNFFIKIKESVDIIIVEQFYDYETGIRLIGIIQNKPENLKFNNDVVYISEFNILSKQLTSLKEQKKAVDYYRNYLENKIKAKNNEFTSEGLYERKLKELNDNFLYFKKMGVDK